MCFCRWKNSQSSTTQPCATTLSSSCPTSVAGVFTFVCDTEELGWKCFQFIYSFLSHQTHYHHRAPFAQDGGLPQGRDGSCAQANSHAVDEVCLTHVVTLVVFFLTYAHKDTNTHTFTHKLMNILSSLTYDFLTFFIEKKKGCYLRALCCWRKSTSSASSQSLLTRISPSSRLVSWGSLIKYSFVYLFACLLLLCVCVCVYCCLLCASHAESLLSSLLLGQPVAHQVSESIFQGKNATLQKKKMLS